VARQATTRGPESLDATARRSAALPLAIAAALIVLLASLTAVRPQWFVGPAGRIAFFGGPIIALLFVIGLALRMRLIYALSVAGLAAWVVIGLQRLDAGVGSPGAYGLLVGAAGVALALLVLPRPSRAWFFRPRAVAHRD